MNAVSRCYTPAAMQRFSLRPSSLALILTAAASLTACQSNGGSEGEDGNSEEDGGSELRTYWDDVAPIYFDNCVTCHREGGIGPFRLDEYESAKSWAEASAMAVENRTMPPWLVTDDGTCGDFANSRALEPADIDTIMAWVDEGTQEGTERDDLTIPEPPQITGNTFNLETPEFFPEPQGGFLATHDEYRCFLFDPELDDDTFLTGYNVLPGNEALVHHVLMFTVDPDAPGGGGQSNADVMQALDDESPDRLGWPCFGFAGDNVNVKGVPVSWAPGQGVVELPANTGYRLLAEDQYVVQVHYNMFNEDLIGESDQSLVELQYNDEVEKEGFFDLPDGLLETLATGVPYALPAGEEETTFTFEIEADDYIAPGEDSTEVWGFFPHLHEYGTALTTRILDENGEEIGCLGDVKHWDFGWQIYYFYEEAVTLQAGHKLEVTCTYDTTSSESDIYPGWGTLNEMCLSGIYVVP